jgi:hypothetical protein
MRLSQPQTKIHRMKYIILCYFFVIAPSSNLVASQQTDREFSLFNGFNSLLLNTDVVVIVQFEPDSLSSFIVVEMLYPKPEHINSYFSTYENITYGMVNREYIPDNSYRIVPGQKYLVFLKRNDAETSRWTDPTGNFALPSYACSYRFADNNYAAIPLFDLDNSTLIKKMYSSWYGTHVNKDIESSLFTERIKKNFSDVYGTAGVNEVVDAIRNVVRLASNERLKIQSSIKLSDDDLNLTYKKIINDITKNGSFNPGIFEFPPPPEYAAQEPPARKKNLDALHKGPLSRIILPSFKAKGIPFNDALAQLEEAIRQAPGFENFKFIVSEMLQESLLRHPSPVHLTIRKLPPSVVLDLMSHGKYIEIRENNIVYIDLL